MELQVQEDRQAVPGDGPDAVRPLGHEELEAELEAADKPGEFGRHLVRGVEGGRVDGAEHRRGADTGRFVVGHRSDTMA